MGISKFFSNAQHKKRRDAKGDKFYNKNRKRRILMRLRSAGENPKSRSLCGFVFIFFYDFWILIGVCSLLSVKNFKKVEKSLMLFDPKIRCVQCGFTMRKCTHP